MTILFDATRPVKPASDFGRGIAARFVPSDADRAWAAYHLNADCTDYDVIEPARDWDQLAGEAEAVARHEAGMTGTY